MIKGPISPSDISVIKERQIPQFIYDIVNQLLVERLKSVNTLVIIQQKEIVDSFTRHNKTGFEYKWLYFESSYRQQGWDVTYACENNGAYYTFSVKRRGTGSNN